MMQGLLQIGFVTGLFHALQNTIEKIIFNRTEGNINDYIMLRLIFMTLIFAVIYFFIPSMLSIVTKTKLDILRFTKINYGLIIASSCFVIISVYFMILGISKFNISVFTPVYLITYLCLNVCIGIFLFKESVTINKIIGLAFAITTIILFNLDNI